MIYKSLDYIIKNLLIEQGIFNDNRYMRYLTIAINGARELSFILPHNIKTVRLVYDPNKGYIDLPKDCVSYTKIGVVYNGKVNLMGLNRNLAHKERIIECDPVVLDTTQQCEFNNYECDGEIGAIYGYGSGQNFFGEYVENYETNRIEFSDRLSTREIYLEYKSNGIQADGTALIPEIAVMSLMEFINWRLSKHTKTMTGYDKERARKDFIKAKKDTRRRMMFTLEEYIESSGKYYMQAPK